jgi:hypothetical protein
MMQYRGHFNVPGKVPCVLGMDATSMTGTGIKLRTNTGHVFAFLILPLCHECPDWHIHSVPHATGKMDGDVLAIRNALHEVMTRNGFTCHF